MKIPLIKPFITDETKQAVLDVLESGYLTEGPVTRQLEDAFRDYIGVGHALAMTSCTTGLETALRAAGVGPGDDVIVPDYTYPATAAAVAICGAVPVIVDIDPRTMLIDYDALEAAVSPRTKAVIPVSLFGNPLDYDRLKDAATRHGFVVIEDAACSVGAEYRGVRVGKHADVSVFSLHPRKFITTGEGGMVTTDRPDWAAWMDQYKHFGMNSSDSRLGTWFDMIGTNYKLSNLQAAVGLSQMRAIDTLLEGRRRLARRYLDLLSGAEGVTVPETTSGGSHSYQSFCIFIDERDRVMQSLRNEGIEVQIGTYSLHMHRAFNDNPRCRIFGDMKNSRHVFGHCLALPLYHDMAESDQNLVVERLLHTIIK